MFKFNLRQQDCLKLNLKAKILISNVHVFDKSQNSMSEIKYKDTKVDIIVLTAQGIKSALSLTASMKGWTIWLKNVSP